MCKPKLEYLSTDKLDFGKYKGLEIHEVLSVPGGRDWIVWALLNIKGFSIKNVHPGGSKTTPTRKYKETNPSYKFSWVECLDCNDPDCWMNEDYW